MKQGNFLLQKHMNSNKHNINKIVLALNFSFLYSLEFCFYGYGCCDFDGIIREPVYNIDVPAKISLNECKKECLSNKECIAFDISGDVEDQFVCHISIGSGENFRLGCGGYISDPDRDPYKRKCYKLDRPSKIFYESNVFILCSHSFLEDYLLKLYYFLII